MRTRNQLLWIGPLVTLLAAFSYFAFFVRFPAVRDVPWVNVPLVAAGLLLTILAAARPWVRPDRYRGRVLGVPALLVSGLLATGFSLYVFDWSYRVPAPTDAASAMEAAPDFALRAHDGSTVRLSDLRPRKVVLVFYRGHW